ncbi:hypothetical protein Bbelb_307480 [Branchiostoma belcheri]|nr:hypothetical protein Bbelb_307480 [Branchiostoma belcheri]
MATQLPFVKLPLGQEKVTNRPIRSPITADDREVGARTGREADEIAGGRNRCDTCISYGEFEVARQNNNMEFLIQRRAKHDGREAVITSLCRCVTCQRSHLPCTDTGRATERRNSPVRTTCASRYVQNTYKYYLRPPRCQVCSVALTCVPYLHRAVTAKDVVADWTVPNITVEGGENLHKQTSDLARGGTGPAAAFVIQIRAACLCQ